MPDFSRPPSWLHVLKLAPWLAAALTGGIAIGDWRSNQSAALTSMSTQMQVLNNRVDQIEKSQRDTSEALIKLNVRFDDLHDTLSRK